MAKIIGISGISGAGKTTIAIGLAKTIKATALFWDDFDDISTNPEDYVAWYTSGQGNDAWDYPALAAVLETLKKGESTPHPVFQRPLQPTKHIVFDAPMGRLHKQTGKTIDIWVHIDTPLDVALARRTIRDFEKNPSTIPELLAELKYYLSHSRALFFAHEEKNSADLVVDGTLSIEDQIRKIENIL